MSQKLFEIKKMKNLLFEIYVTVKLNIVLNYKMKVKILSPSPVKQTQLVEAS